VAIYEIQKPSTCRATLFHCKFRVDVSCFSPCVINLLCNKTICCRLKKVAMKSRVRIYFEQQILALLLVFHQTHNLSGILTKQINQSVHCFNLQQMSSLHDKLIMQGEKHKTWTQNLQPKTCKTSWGFLYLVFLCFKVYLASVTKTKCWTKTRTRSIDYSVDISTANTSTWNLWSHFHGLQVTR